MELPPLDLTALSDLQVHRLTAELRAEADRVAMVLDGLPMLDPRLLDLQTMFVELESLVSDCLHDLLDRFQATTGLPPF